MLSTIGETLRPGAVLWSWIVIWVVITLLMGVLT